MPGGTPTASHGRGGRDVAHMLPVGYLIVSLPVLKDVVVVEFTSAAGEEHSHRPLQGGSHEQGGRR
ncbi:hypothetical protein GCM10023324_54790 [Streptomyces youssoufiensis]